MLGLDERILMDVSQNKWVSVDLFDKKAKQINNFSGYSHISRLKYMQKHIFDCLSFIRSTRK